MRAAVRKFCRHQHRRLTIQWVPGHKGIDGNERADEIAKQASTGAFRNISHPTSLNTLKHLYRQHTHNQWSKEYELCRSRTHISTQLPSMPNILQIYKNLSMKQCAILARFRSGHTELRSTTMRFYPPDHPKHRPQCPSCNASTESREHILFECPQYDDLRRILHCEMISSIGQRTMSLEETLNDKPLIDSAVRFLCSALARRRT